jgi:hypothetical protein
LVGNVPIHVSVLAVKMLFAALFYTLQYVVVHLDLMVILIEDAIKLQVIRI